MAPPREYRVPFDTMLPLGHGPSARPPLASVTALLVVADTVHATAGERRAASTLSASCGWRDERRP